MAKIRIGTFNCENLFLRYRFTGPSVSKRKGETKEQYDKRLASARKTALATFGQKGCSLDWLARDLEDFSDVSHTQRKATARVITENNPDIVALIEVESMEALRKFNSAQYFGDNQYEHSMLIDGRDPRGIDIAVLSKYPIVHIRSYMDDSYKSPKGKNVWTFSRDCLVVRIDIDGTPVTLFINHFKSQMDDNPERRKIQATRVAEIVNETFGSALNKELFAVVGDFNQVPDDPSLQPLLAAGWNTDAVTKIPDAKERWTHVYESDNKVKEVSQLDYILLSKEMERRMTGQPVIERRGLARYEGLDAYYPDSCKRILPSVQGPGTEASDHCPVFVNVEI